MIQHLILGWESRKEEFHAYACVCVCVCVKERERERVFKKKEKIKKYICVNILLGEECGKRVQICNVVEEGLSPCFWT